jgi:hypothetical protein
MRPVSLGAGRLAIPGRGDAVRSFVARRWSRSGAACRLADVTTPADTEPPPPSGTQPPFRERRVKRNDRRAVTWKTLLRSGFTPRRRGGRRASDQEQAVDFHEPELLFFAIVMLLLSLVDALLTVKLMTDGAEETNPLLAFVLNEHPRLFAVVKMTLTGGGVLLLVAVGRMRLFRIVRAGVFLPLLALAYLALVIYEAWLVGSMP